MPPELSDKQRGLLIDFFKNNPDSGYKVAVRTVGRETGDQALARITQTEAKALVEHDDELLEATHLALKLDKPSLLKVIGEIASDKDHKDRLRAATFGLAALHQLHEQKSSLDVTVGGSGRPIEIEDRSASLADVARILIAAGAIDGRATGRVEVPVPRGLLAEPSEG